MSALLKEELRGSVIERLDPQIVRFYEMNNNQSWLEGYSSGYNLEIHSLDEFRVKGGYWSDGYDAGQRARTMGEEEEKWKMLVQRLE